MYLRFLVTFILLLQCVTKKKSPEKSQGFDEFIQFYCFLQVLTALYIIQMRKQTAMNGIRNAKNTAASTIITMKIMIPRIHASNGAKTGRKVTNKSNTVKIPISVNIHIVKPP